MPEDCMPAEDGGKEASSSPTGSRVVVIGTRESELAMIQARQVQALLQAAHPELTFPINGMTTTGDQILDVALSKIGAKSLFTKELEVALADGRVDLVVHSLKDLPTTLPPGMAVGAMMERVDPRDVMVLRQAVGDAASSGPSRTTLADLPAGSVIGTSSVRRSAQLRHRYPHLQFQDIRGNLNTRLRKLDAPDSPYAALILARAGIERLGWSKRITQVLDADVMLYAVGQGALGIECRAEDTRVLELLTSLEHPPTRLRCSAERAFMRRLEGGCSVPLGVCTHLDPQDTLDMQVSVTALDGSRHLRARQARVLGPMDRAVPGLDVRIREAEALGEALAVELMGQGAVELLADIRRK